jgi:hypothetical protein
LLLICITGPISSSSAPILLLFEDAADELVAEPGFDVPIVASWIGKNFNYFYNVIFNY